MRFTKQKLFLTACLFLALFSFISPQPAQARGLVPCGGYADDQGTREKPCTLQDAFVLIARVTNFLIAMAGIYAVYKIVGAGWGFTTALGNEEKLTQLKGQISDAVVGMVLVMLAFMLINFVTNYLITRNLVLHKPQCKFDLTAPLNYLRIDTTQCNGQQDATLYGPGNPGGQ